MKSIAGLKFPILAFVGSLALVGCSSSEESSTAPSSSSAVATSMATTAPSTHKASLADWDGKYASLAAYLDDASYDADFEAAAKEHGEDVTETKAKLKERYGVPFGALVIDGDTVTFVKDGATLDNPSETPIKYTFDEGFEQEYKGHQIKWSVFKAEGDADYKYIFLMPMHGEESLQHFHARFGNDKDAMKQEETFPTFVDPKVATKEQIVDELMEHAH
ncbi:ZinT/AdcA family metal-binding protein [Corynebacterium belfantii]|uniref:ZinT/AdcA family metal-binding protein n=1 Tax=Corynebacterium belfantii TaxID=2014537 RepID=UPI0018D2A767|nr:ZinT/AdcA family metal-binding protein [Corynebacterium belfantii]MBG9244401.1 ZinT/AdcA family metal-binding protein [Corynebacterium belfantii]MBG9333065.1 ZinT/AdcA family metal-binding protein [Corynebacterium belfantii]